MCHVLGPPCPAVGEYASGAKHPAVVELLMEWGVRAEMLLGAAER